jgi:hypothetical protein
VPDFAAPSPQLPPDERREVVEDLLRNLMLLADRDQVVDDEPLRRSSASLAALTSVIAAGVS